jgi:pilus assembly protein Flp/PilA
MTTKLYVTFVTQLAKLRSKRGQTLVEYGLILALVSIVVITVLSVLGTSIKGVFNTITSTLTHLPASS